MWQVRLQLFYSYCVWYCYLEEETVTDSVNTRELILGILMEVTKEGSYSHLVIRSVLDKYQYLEKKERAFITRVSEGTIQYIIRRILRMTGFILFTFTLENRLMI